MSDPNKALAKKIEQSRELKTSEQLTVNESIKVLQRAIENRADKIIPLLKGTGVSAERFRLNALQVVAKDPQLIQCAMADGGASFIGGVLAAAADGLDFGKLNEAFLVPRGTKNGLRLCYQRGYKGVLRMARRSANIREIAVDPIYENDRYERKLGTDRGILHVPAKLGTDPGKIIGFVAIAITSNGVTLSEEMSVPDIIKHYKRFTTAKNFGPFAKLDEKGIEHENFEAYGLKTTLIQLCNRQLDLESAVATALKEEWEEGEALPVDPSVLQGSKPLKSNDPSLYYKHPEVMAEAPPESRVLTPEAPEPVQVDGDQEIDTQGLSDSETFMWSLPLSMGSHVGEQVGGQTAGYLFGYLKKYGKALDQEERQACHFVAEMKSGNPAGASDVPS